MHHRLRVLSILCLLPLLAACGFKPHTFSNASLQNETFYIASTAENQPFRQALTQALQQKAMTVIEAPKQASIAVEINFAHTQIGSPSLNASHKMRIYPLTFTLEYSILKNSEPLIANQLLVLHKNIIMRSNESLNTNKYLSTALSHLYQETAAQLLMQLAIKTS